MDPSSDEAPLSPRPLHCLGGREAPPEVLRDVRLLASLSPKARDGLWRALGPCLTEAPSGAGPGGAAAVEERLEQLRREGGVSADELARLLKSARFLLREAAKHGVERHQFAQDLGSIFSGEGEGDASRALIAGFDDAMEDLRAEIIEGSLADHGKLLVGVDWRVDTLSTSSRGSRLRTPVVVLTLRYQDGERRERITLQALPAVLDQLRQVCEAILE